MSRFLLYPERNGTVWKSRTHQEQPRAGWTQPIDGALSAGQKSGRAGVVPAEWHSGRGEATETVKRSVAARG